MTWSFGREFGDRTIADLLAAVWCMLLVFGLGLVIGAGLRLPGWSAEVAWHGLGRLLATAAMTVLLAWTFALVASIARGYLVPAGAMFLTVSWPRSSPRSAMDSTSPGRRPRCTAG